MPQCLAVNLLYHMFDEYAKLYITAVFLLLVFLSASAFCAALCETMFEYIRDYY